jgi:hypothetical protein
MGHHVASPLLGRHPPNLPLIDLKRSYKSSLELISLYRHIKILPKRLKTFLLFGEPKDCNLSPPPTGEG